MSRDEFETTLMAAQAGGGWAVAALYKAHNPKLVRYLRAQAPGDHEDIASETWLDAARNLHRFSGDEDALAGWLFTIARRRLVDHRRAKQRRPVEPAPDATFADLSTASAEAVAWTGAIGDAEARRIVELLPADQAEVLLLRVVGGLDVDVVARMTGRRPGTVRVVQHRALKRLAKELGGGRNAAEEVDDGTLRDAQAPTLPR
jgi:RNA polymerase sigma-70 factor (ECF subfamily)